MKQWRWTAMIGSLLLLVLALTWGAQYVGSRLGFRIPLVTGARHEPDPDATVRSLQHITGAGTLDELIGKRIEVSATAEQISMGTAFWANAGDSPVLVVMSRDRRDEVARANGQVAPHGIRPVTPGEKLQVPGAIQRVPPAESRFSWGLYGPQHQGHLDAKVYLQADTARPE